MSVTVPLDAQIKHLLKDGGKHDPRTVFDTIRARNKNLDNGDIRYAIYVLMDRREIELTSDRYLRLLK